MKFLILCTLALLAVATAKPGAQYTNRYDNLDLDEILSNKKLLTTYLKCILDQGRCTNEGKELKSHIREALENNCGKCTEQQQTGSRKVIGHLINKESGYWNQLTAKYDPTHKYTSKYEQELRQVQG